MFTYVPTPNEMSMWDAACIAIGIQEDVLMENAARAAMECLRRRIPLPGGVLKGLRVLLVAGGGNNGGDAFCMARHCADSGALATLIIAKAPKGDSAAARWLDVLRQYPVSIVPAQEWLDGSTQIFDGLPPQIVIDGLLGTGFHGQLRDQELRIIQKINELKKLGTHIFAIDIPSGINGDNGRPSPIAVVADATATFEAPKPGLLMPHSSAFTGMLDICSIGMPRMAASKVKASFQTWLLPAQAQDAANGTWQLWRREIPAAHNARALCPDASWHAPSHKGEAGKVLIIGGSPMYASAPCLSALGAFRAGAGLVTVAGPDPVPNTLRSVCPASITALLPSKKSGHSWEASDLTIILPAMLQADSVVIGPGFGRGEEEEALIDILVSTSGRPPLIIDADALFAISRRPKIMQRLSVDDIITPHPGEAATLIGVSTGTVQNDRIAALRHINDRCPATCVLKGEGTLIGRYGDPIVIAPWSIPQLAVAGSGDVLAGLAAAMMAQQKNSLTAATIAVWAHALAGASIAARFPLRGNTPQDIADAIPGALAEAYA